MELKKVPFSDTFYADTEGNIFDSKGVKRNTSINGDGYITVNLKKDRIKVIDGWIALYASDQNAKKIKSYISSPVVV